MKWYDRYNNTPKKLLSMRFKIFRFRAKWDDNSTESKIFAMFKAVVPQKDD